MPQFRYQAIDSDGITIHGELSGHSPDDVAERLESRGLKVELVEFVDVGVVEVGVIDVQALTPQLSASEFTEVVGRIGDLAKMERPLATGLMALSQELPGRRVRKSLQSMSNRLVAGESIESIVSTESRGLPKLLQTLVEVGVKTGRLGLLLDQYVRFSRESRDLRLSIFFSLTYPAFLLSVASIVCFMLFGIVSEFKQIFEDFDMQLPWFSIVVYAISEFISSVGVWVVVGGLAFILTAWFAFDIFRKQAERRHLLRVVPVIGPLLEFAAQSRFCYLLGMLVKYEVPLSKALLLAGHGAKHAGLQRGCRLAAASVDDGVDLQAATVAIPFFSNSLLSLFRWQKRGAAFPEALLAAADTFAAQAKVQSRLVGIFYKPFIIIGVGVFVAVIVIALFLPMYQMLENLSSW